VTIPPSAEPISRFPLLFEPLELGSKVAKNRIVSTAHATRLDAAGLLGEEYIRYYERKAEGGLGVLCTFGSASVHRDSTPSYGCMRLWEAANEPMLEELADRVHAHGALILSQATHLGRRGQSRKSGTAVSAPSALPEPVNRDVPHVLSRHEIRDIVDAFAAAAARLERCGWDGVEITSFGGHLIEQFLSPLVNTRTDEYGGDFAGRLRFAREVIERVGDAVSPSFLVAFRMTGDPLTDTLGLDRDDMLEVARALDEIGRIDLFSISGGTGAVPEAQAATVPPDYFPRRCYAELGKAMKGAVKVPVLLAGRILDAEDGEATLASGEADLVGMTRALIADPDLPRKAASGEHARVRPCMAISQDCIGRVNLGMGVICAVNPEIGRTPPAPRDASDALLRVVVVGGGPAGLEAARVAAEHGHDVVLFECENRLGGQVRIGAAVDDRPSYAAHVDWLEQELGLLGVSVERTTEATARTVLEQEPDAVIIATGSTAALPDEVTDLTPRSTTDVALLAGDCEVDPSWRVAVYDNEGYIRGAYAALIARAAGAEVQLVTSLPAPCAALDPWLRPQLLRRLGRTGVRYLVDKELVGDDADGLVVKDAWSDELVTVAADLFVFVGYQRARAGLAEELRAERPDLPLTLVGDCLAPRRVSDAVSEGARAGARPLDGPVMTTN
jgi:2,4-dienoyl-CoA reductase-like NADH-dependent reductase (Old Yellow Enzyme family)/thioredoxin reductase